MAAPAFGQRLDLKRAAQRVHVVALVCVEPNDVGHSDAVLILTDKLDAVASFDESLLRDGEIKARQPALQETLKNVCAAKLDAELVAGQARLRHHQPRLTDAELVADVDSAFRQAFGRK